MKNISDKFGRFEKVCIFAAPNEKLGRRLGGFGKRFFKKKFGGLKYCLYICVRFWKRPQKEGGEIEKKQVRKTGVVKDFGFAKKVRVLEGVHNG